MVLVVEDNQKGARRDLALVADVGKESPPFPPSHYVTDPDLFSPVWVA